MKIFATGDTHWNFERFRPEYFPEGQELTKKDVVLQLGDFVGVWFGDKRDDEALDTLLQTELPEAELYLEIGRAICARPEKGAAVMAAGNCGWGCGSGPNAVANEKAVMDQYGWHNVAWILYPSFAVIIDDIYNPIFLSLFGSFFAG